MATKYHVLLADYSGTSLQDALDTITCCPYGLQNTVDTSGVYMIIDAGKDRSVSEDSVLDDYVPTYPAWMLALAADPKDCTHDEARAIVAADEWTGA